MTPRQVSKLMIARANKKTNTKGERQFNEYQESRVMNLRHGHAGEGTTLTFWDIESGNPFDFQCDFLRLRYAGMAYNIDYIGSYDIDFEIDGKGHKEKWDEWKDKIKVNLGLKVIHIPEAITHERHWLYLDGELDRAIKSKEMVHYIAG